MNEIIIGAGQVGTGLAAMLRPTSQNLIVLDKEGMEYPWENQADVSMLHICIGDSDEFVPIVQKYVEKFRPKVVVIHSTVVIGKTWSLEALVTPPVVHSPIRGQHPDLSGGIKTFRKFFSGSDIEAVEYVMERFELAGIACEAMGGGTKATEIAKLACTFRYGLNIAGTQMVERLCKKYGVRFDEVYNAWEESYNDGYHALGMDHVRRPILFPGIIGGHCVVPNLLLLAKTDPDPLIDAILSSNEEKKKESV